MTVRRIARCRDALRLVVLTLVIGLIGCNSSDGDTTTQSLQERIASIASNNGIPSVAAAIVTADGVQWESFVGSKDPSGAPPDEDTIYVIASISKLVTATAALQLVESNAVDLDEDVNGYLPFAVRNPSFPDTPITLRMLMTHRASLAWPTNEDPDFYTNYPGDSAPPLGRWLAEYIIPDGENYRPQIWKNWKPGTLVSYSNIGAALVGYLVEEVSGEDFAFYCEDHIFEPLGMMQTHFYNQGVVTGNRAAIYLNAAQTTQDYSVAFYPATTVRTSIREFSRFAMAYMNGGTLDGVRILTEESVAEAWRLQVPGEGVGLFWWQIDDNRRGHTGGYTGVSSTLTIDASRGNAIIIFANVDGADAVYPGGSIYQAVKQEALAVSRTL